MMSDALYIIHEDTSLHPIQVEAVSCAKVKNVPMRYL